MVEWEVEQHGKATVDVEKYRARRFDDVATFELEPAPKKKK